MRFFPADFQGKSRLAPLLPALFALAALLTSASALTEEITSIGIAFPPAILDADQVDVDPATNRHGLETDVEVQITRGVFEAAINTDYKVVSSLEDQAGNQVLLSSGSFSEESTPFKVSLSGFFGTLHIENLVLNPDPDAILDPAERYRVVAQLEKWDGLNWLPVHKNSTGFAPVLHFTNLASGDADWNIRGTIISLSWDQKFLVDSDSNNDALLVDVSAFFERYDDFEIPIAQVNSKMIFDFDLLDGSNTSVPLVGDGIVMQDWIADSYDDSSGRPLPVINIVFLNAVELHPAGQLDPVNEQYRLVCNLRHIEDLANTEHLNMVQTLAPETLLHFNGNLRWGTFFTQFTGIDNQPMPLGGSPVHVDTTIVISNEAGVLPDNPGYVFGDGATLLGVKLLANGDALLPAAPFQSLPVHPPGNPAGEVEIVLNCLTATYTGGVNLSPNGANAAGITIELPQGLGYIADYVVSPHRGVDNFFQLGPYMLAPDLNPSANLTFGLPANAAVFDESHPLVFRTGSFTLELDGTLEFNTTSAKYIHDDPLNFLEGLPAGTLDDPAYMTERLSNDLYLRKVLITATGFHKWNAAADKSARLSGSIGVQAYSFHAHFPIQTEIAPASDSTLVYLNGSPVSAASELDNVVQVRVPYSQDCPEGVDPCPGDGLVTVDLNPDGNRLTHTPTGGLWRAGKVANVPLKWGARGDGMGNVGNPAHETDPFNFSTFFMPGYQLYAEDNSVLSHPVFGSAGGDHAPGALLLSAFNENVGSPQNYYPTDNRYVDGDGSYGGLNFIVTAPGFRGRSRLGGDPVGFDYELLETNNSSKYYIRTGGVSGRHVARDGTWVNPLIIYGFEFEFTSYQLAFIDSALNDPEGSWVDGQITVSGYSNFTQKFSGLTMNCLGELEGADIDPNDLGDKSLTYWNSVFQPKTMEFSKKEKTPGACPLVYEAILVMGIKTEVAHVPTTLHGVFGFWPNGNLATPADGYEGTNATKDVITSELGLPSSLKLEGPNKDYNVVPTGKLRFNNPDPSGHGINEVLGFVTWGATLDVPFFEDFQVQCITSASPIPAAPFYVTPGWDEAGLTFFTSSQFDPDHNSWPLDNGDGVSLDDYKNPDNTIPPSYLVHAKQDIFGKIDLDYPLDWDDNLRRFKSMDPVVGDIFVVNVQHEIPYLDAKFAQIEFGAKYDGLPELSITNLLNDQIDGAADALTAAISAPLKGAIDEAFEKFEEMLSDTLSSAIDPIIDEAATLVLDPLYDKLKHNYSGLITDWTGAGGGMETALQSFMGGANSTLGLQLQTISEVANGLNDANSFVAGLQNAVASMIIGIDTLANQVELNGGVPQLNLDLSALPGGVSPGVLYKNAGEYEIISDLVKLLLKNLVEPSVAAILTPLLDAAASELNAELNALLEEIEPVLEQVVDALNQTREFLVQIHEALDVAGDLINEIQGVVDQAAMAAGEIETMLDQILVVASSKLNNLIDSVGVTGAVSDHFSIFAEMPKEEFIDLLKAEIKDLLLESDLVSSIRYLVKQNLYDLEIKFRSTIQSVFSQISDVMKELVSGTIGSLEKEFAPMLGAVSNFLGSAEITGFAEFNGDSLRKLRMDLMAEFQLPDPMKIHVYLEILVITSEDNFTENACLEEGEKAVEVHIGAVDVPMDWLSDGLRATIEVKMSLKTEGADLVPNGVGGSLELTGGTINFQAVKISCFAVAVSIGLEECYIAAKACVLFNNYELSAGIFFGRACTLDPLYLVDADVADLIDPGTTFTGVYVYGEVWLPISEIILGIPASCLFRISAGIGVGNGLFIEGPTFIAKMLLGVSGEALCIVSFEGIIKMVGVYQAGKFKASGAGSFKACVGFAFFKICFKANIQMKYDDGSWSVDY